MAVDQLVFRYRTRHTIGRIVYSVQQRRVSLTGRLDD